MRHRSVMISALSVAALAATAAVAAPAAQGEPLPPGLSVVASGLTNPTHIAFGPGNSLYAADIGTGSVVKINLGSGTSTTFASGLGFSPGVDARGNGTVFMTSTLGSPEEGTPPARLLRGNAAGRTWLAADTLAYELAHNPDGQSQAVDAKSNPYSVLALPGRTIVADAGANDLLEVRANGAIRTLTVFPVIHDGPDCSARPENDPGQTGCDPVPTDVEMGPDGFLYVSGLSAEAEGQGRIYKVDATTGAIVRTWTGFPPLTGIAVAPDGTIYAATLFFGNSVIRIQGDTVTSAVVPVPSDVEVGHGMVLAASFAGLVFSIDPSAFH
jgi:sugar lactone lactonase YvrE